MPALPVSGYGVGPMETLALIAGGGFALFIAGGFIVGFLMRNKDLAGVLLALAMVCAIVAVWKIL